KIMSIPDDLMEEYFSLITTLDEDTFKKLIKENPRNAKGMLAKEIVKEFFNEKIAEEAERDFEKVFKEKQAPDEMPEFFIEKGALDNEGKIAIVDLLFNSGILPSKMEARRMITQKAVKIDNQTIEDQYARVKVRNGQVLKVGKRKFLKIRIKE
ncbi:MAG TPA: S4 domain-containing protein, partial [bacterium]|nr:S4 domain-containing protein [bacterium]